MSTYQVEVTDEEREALEEVARRRQTTADRLIREVVGRFASEALAGDAVASDPLFERWRAAAMRMAGMWKDRDDLPDFDALRRGWDRGFVERE